MALWAYRRTFESFVETESRVLAFFAGARFTNCALPMGRIMRDASYGTLGTCNEWLSVAFSNLEQLWVAIDVQGSLQQTKEVRCREGEEV